MSKAYQRENSWGKGGRMKGNAIVKKLKKKGSGTKSDWRPSNPATECNAMQQWDPDGSPWELSATALLWWHGWACVLKELAVCACPKQWVWHCWGQSWTCLTGSLQTYCICGDNSHDRPCIVNGCLCGTQVQTNPCPGITKTEHLLWVHAFIFQSNLHRVKQAPDWMCSGAPSFYIKRKFFFSHRDNLHKEVCICADGQSLVGMFILTKATKP